MASRGGPELWMSGHTLRTVRGALPTLRLRLHPRILGNKDLLDYSMTKGGIHAFTRSLATHLIDRGIRANAVAPGPVWTPLNPTDKSADKVASSAATHR
jgi:NAD(P)-dependent dehydrogenase (short-subunit alcohol dehydrogenase family)